VLKQSTIKLDVAGETIFSLKYLDPDAFTLYFTNPRSM